ncbi:MAG TPA: tyrosine--tRNA ligase [Candidatus Dormibacteraeota bacterium]|nr:tyrosine--tRNA ligase [Candidatus Dormibacteraeota bacterium]
MTLTEELSWRGFDHQTTYADAGRLALDGEPIKFYWGVDPSADSMTIGNLAAAMMVRHFIDYGHQATLLVGGATGLIGDPDGKSEERELKSFEEIAANKAKIAAQYQNLFADQPFEIVDNYDWFKDVSYLDFLRDIGKHVPLTQMLGREFVRSRLGEDGEGISYAAFSYVLIQAYDFLRLYEDKQVTLQLCGSDQWGNSIAGVDLIRRKSGGEAHVYSTSLIVNKATGQKFGKSEAGAVWLDPEKTTPTQFYQFWINLDDDGVEDYLKVFTLLDRPTIEDIMSKQQQDPGARIAQTRLADEVTDLVHGEERMKRAKTVTEVLTGKTPLASISETDSAINDLRAEIPCVKATDTSEIAQTLVDSGLATSKNNARQLITSNAISINGQKVNREQFEPGDFQNGRLMIRRGKAFKDSALIEVV